MAIDYSNFKASLKNLETQHEHLLQLPPTFPTYVHEGMAESVIQRFETCYDALWKVLRRHLIEVFGIAEVPNSPRPILRIADQNGLLAAGADQWELYAQTRIDTSQESGVLASLHDVLLPWLVEGEVRLEPARPLPTGKDGS